MNTKVVSFSPDMSVHGPPSEAPDCHCMICEPDPPVIFAVNVVVPPTHICVFDTDTLTVGSGLTTASATFEITGLGQSL